MSFLLHELAVNVDVQLKLYEEIRNVQKDRNESELDWGTLTEMKYMDMAVSESLRKWAPEPSTHCYVKKPYIIENTDGTKVQLKVGDIIQIPTFALHMDQKYFQRPERFNPERFRDENTKDKIIEGAYTPFGIGPSELLI